MGLETPAEYGGAECSFTAAILAVEGNYLTGQYLIMNQPKQFHRTRQD